MADPKYAALFLAESREHLRSCNDLLLEWERTPGASEPVNGLFRAIHNMKGMAATLGYSAVADLAHRSENVLDAVRSGRASGTPELIQLLFKSVDALEKAVEGAQSGKGEPSAKLLAALDKAAVAAGGEKVAAEASPTGAAGSPAPGGNPGGGAPGAAARLPARAPAARGSCPVGAPESGSVRQDYRASSGGRRVGA
jgi:two-component system chemotaxis sensor kinase CheA